MHIVHPPHFVRTGRKRLWHPRFGSKSLAPPTLHCQPFLPVQPIHSLVVSAEAFRTRCSPVAGKCTVADSRIVGARLLTRAAEPATLLCSVPFAGTANSPIDQSLFGLGFSPSTRIGSRVTRWPSRERSAKLTCETWLHSALIESE